MPIYQFSAFLLAIGGLDKGIKIPSANQTIPTNNLINEIYNKQTQQS
jgi:hypothetical protein